MEVCNAQGWVENTMSSALMRVLGPPAYLSAALALAWTPAVWGALAGSDDMTPAVPIPWAEADPPGPCWRARP